MDKQPSTHRAVRKNRDGLFSKKIVRQVLLVINLFTIVVLFVSYKTGGSGLDSLIKEYFSFFRIEVLALAGIRISKTTFNGLMGIAEIRKEKKDSDINYG